MHHPKLNQTTFKKFAASVVAFLILLTFFTPTTEALSCIEPEATRMMEHSDAAIVGQVTDVKVNKWTSSRTVTVTILESYKGINDKTVTFTEDSMWGNSEVDEQYIYFLNEEDGDWVLPLCSDLMLNPGNHYAETVYEELKANYPLLSSIAQSNIDTGAGEISAEGDKPVEVQVVNQPGEVLVDELTSSSTPSYMSFAIALVLVVLMTAGFIVRRVKRDGK